MTNNMGTPSYPEGLAHFSVKALLANTLQVCLRKHEPRTYAGLLPNELRKTELPGNASEDFVEAFTRVKERLDARPPVYYVVYNEPECQKCDGGVVVTDILSGCEGGRVVQEKPFAGFIPDIAVYGRNNSERPACIIEIVDTSPPPTHKVSTFASLGIPVYQVDARNQNPMIVMDDLLPVTPLGPVPCGRDLRSQVENIDQFWANAANPFVGIKFFPSGTQEYIYGEHDDGDMTWQLGDPEIRGLCKMDVAWQSVPMVKPFGNPRHITRELFMAYMMWCKARCLQVANSRTSVKPHPSDSEDWFHLTKLEATILRHIDDLVNMVRFPQSS